MRLCIVHFSIFTTNHINTLPRIQAMVEFNPDGSIRIPGAFAQAKSDRERRMRETRCAHIVKEMVSETAPKKCALHIRLSDAIPDGGFLHALYTYFNSDSQTPTKLITVSDREFDIEIGSDFRRCSDCRKLIGRIREFLDDSVIEDQGSCAHPPREFCFEDHFE